MERAEQASDTVPSSWGGHSNRIAAVNLEKKPHPVAIDDLDEHDHNHTPHDQVCVSFSKFLRIM